MFIVKDYNESLDNFDKKYLVPEQTSFYMHVPSRIDPSAAPEGCDAVSVCLPISNLQAASRKSYRGFKQTDESTKYWDDIVVTTRDTILETVKARLDIDLIPHIIEESFNTPLT
ncbi:phytoene dehydrogenase [Pyrenophora tritici-repentis]|uniref:Phytoene dehydrogenase n=2 Tax=Pyrenophora tritici-repentis TaxID=45151 RepID=A0A2W1DI51_9PLEO|nr:phytoene dehydrogenase [Pyrenophora tritici-repentis Pt-1C-BFP]KAA8618825.1 Phytoene dehydrogenase [Pyrenophora tritici-repentis]EDU48659.1 phytoene dehydrogenase [Pyrenophora tritici-repentis Pt-1C-BFP]KAF7449292.1 Phytoene dehydrogenase [Pyrenophora tritici-repentis]KAF7570694.1 hypothetical protein PtrM4_106960 [Pyrenophora tritici-repentis]KAG9383764.1 Phytoene dehydrogenase [Pyrenophora tritici-repentis]